MERGRIVNPFNHQVGSNPTTFTIMTNKEKTEIQRKLALPTLRDSRGQLIPTSFTDKESQYIIDVLLKPIRDKNLQKFGGGIQKHWSKMSKKEKACN